MTDPVAAEADPVPAEPEGYDDLADAAAREQAHRRAARRQLRAWPISTNASAGLILLAVTVIWLINGPVQRAPDRVPAVRSLPYVLFSPPGLVHRRWLRGGRRWRR